MKQKFQCPTDAEAYYLGGSASAHKDGVDNPSSLSQSFTQCCAKFGVEVPNDFIELAVKAMIHLKENHRSNVLYNLVKGLGVMRQDKSDTRFPMKVMPMGLLEYMVNFYTAEEMRKVSGNVPCTLLLHLLTFT